MHSSGHVSNHKVEDLALGPSHSSQAKKPWTEFVNLWEGLKSIAVSKPLNLINDNMLNSRLKNVCIKNSEYDHA